eukprot:gene6824-10989_t
MFRSLNKTKQLFKTNKNTNFIRLYSINSEDLQHVSSFPENEQHRHVKVYMESPQAACMSKENTKQWRIQWVKGESGTVWSDPLMGCDPSIQLQLSQAKRFRTKEEAVEYAEKNGFKILDEGNPNESTTTSKRDYESQFVWTEPQENSCLIWSKYSNLITLMNTDSSNLAHLVDLSNDKSFCVLNDDIPEYLFSESMNIKPNFSKFDFFDETVLYKNNPCTSKAIEWSPPIYNGKSVLLIQDSRNHISLYAKPDSLQTSFEKILELNEIIFENKGFDDLMIEEVEEYTTAGEIKKTPSKTPKTAKFEKTITMDKIFDFFWNSYLSFLPNDYLSKQLPELNKIKARRLNKDEKTAKEKGMDEALKEFPEDYKTYSKKDVNHYLQTKLRLQMKDIKEKAEKDESENNQSTPKKSTSKNQSTPKRKKPTEEEEEIVEETPKKKLPKKILATDLYLRLTNRFKINSITWSEITDSNSAYLALGNRNGEIFILEVKFENNELTAKLIQQFDAHETQISCLKFKETSSLFSSDIEGNINQYQLKNGKFEMVNFSHIQKNEIPNGIPISFFKIFVISKTEYFLIICQGFEIIIIKFENDKILFKTTLNDHFSTINGIEIMKSGKSFILFTCGFDGLLMQYFISETFDISKNTLIKTSFLHPIFGIALSPNDILLSILIEYPGDLSKTFSFESKGKTKISMYSTMTTDNLDLIIDKLIEVCEINETKKFKYSNLDVLDFISTLPKESIKTIVDRLYLEYQTKGIIGTLKFSYLILSFIPTTQQMYEGFEEQINSFKTILMFQYCSDILHSFLSDQKDISSNEILCICDWMLQFLILTLTEDSSIESFENAKLKLNSIENVYKKFKGNENCLSSLQKLKTICETKKFETIEIDYPKRYKCPICDEDVKVEFNINQRVCSKNHPFEIDVLTFQIIQKKSLKCTGCSCKCEDILKNQNQKCSLCGNKFIKLGWQ